MPILGIIASSKLAVTSAFESIATATSTGSSTSLTFSSIPSTYRHLHIRGLAFGSGANVLQTRFNGVTTSSYWRHGYYAQSTSNDIARSNAAETAIGLHAASKGVNATYPMTVLIDIFDYAQTGKRKSLISTQGSDLNNAGDSYLNITTGMWTGTAAITEILFRLDNGGAFPNGSTFSLYGIKE